MVKVKLTFLIVLALCLMGLAGCAGKTAKEAALEKKVAELEKQVSPPKNKAPKQEEPKQEEKPVVIQVIDPITKKELKTFTPKDLGYGTDNEKYKAEMEKWAKELARGTQTTPGYDQRMVPDHIDAGGNIVKGKPKVILEEKELLDKIMNASQAGGSVELPLYVTDSSYKPEEVPSLGEIVVASYTTRFNSSVVGRSKNIELSAQAINNVILGVKDTFSFNSTVGPSDMAHGYQHAPEAVDGKLVDGVGGGICQTSSTLYNAIDKLGVAYVEKHHHSLHVGYVPTGRDATVSYGGLDFRFQNTTGVPLLLKAYIKSGALTIEVRTSKNYQTALKTGHVNS